METRTILALAGRRGDRVLLAGCFRVQMDLEVAAENTVSGTAVIAVEESLLELSGQNVDQTCFAEHGPVRICRRLEPRSLRGRRLRGPEDHVRIRAPHRIRRERNVVRRGNR